MTEEIGVETIAVSKKSPALTLILCFFLGLTGAHRFYTGYKKLGFAQLALSISIIGIIISWLWVFVDLISILLGIYEDKDNSKISLNILPFFKIIILILYILVPVIGMNNEEQETSSAVQVNNNIIKRETFDGHWAFNVDKVEVRHVWVSKESKLDGAEVIIDGRTYALTRNLTNIEFLPYKYWKDGESKYIQGYGNICKDILVDTNVCKVSLLDTITYIDKLPMED